MININKVYLKSVSPNTGHSGKKKKKKKKGITLRIGVSKWKEKTVNEMGIDEMGN